MDQIAQFPEWLGAALIGAVLASLGYVGKLIVEAWNSYRNARNEQRARLVELHCLLKAGKTSYLIQHELRSRLDALIAKNQPNLPNEGGVEKRFTAAYKKFSPTEKELHSLIQSITVHSLKPTNEAMAKWLKNDTYFKAQRLDDSLSGRLASQLFDLEAHLLLWSAKYEAWIPGHPEHALVYLADEERHGVGFPKGIDSVIEEAIGK
jgi:hypothetical protein